MENTMLEHSFAGWADQIPFSTQEQNRKLKQQTKGDDS
jgi:hypothetical protein